MRHGIQGFIRVNDLNVVGLISAADLYLDFPLSIPQPGTSPAQAVVLSLGGGSFDIGLSLQSQGPATLENLFGDAPMDNLTIAGTLQVLFPIQAGVQSETFEMAVLVKDQDLFDSATPLLSYELDVCSIKNATRELFAGLTEQVSDMLRAKLQLSGFVDLTEISDTLVSSVRSSLEGLTDEILMGLDQNCVLGRRHLSTNTSTSFIEKVSSAVDNAKSSLAESGIELYFETDAVFDSESFVFGLEIALGASITMSGLDVIRIAER